MSEKLRIELVKCEAELKAEIDKVT